MRYYFQAIPIFATIKRFPSWSKQTHTSLNRLKLQNYYAKYIFDFQAIPISLQSLKNFLFDTNSYSTKNTATMLQHCMLQQYCNDIIVNSMLYGRDEYVCIYIFISKSFKIVKL